MVKKELYLLDMDTQFRKVIWGFGISKPRQYMTISEMHYVLWVNNMNSDNVKKVLKTIKILQKHTCTISLDGNIIKRPKRNLNVIFYNVCDSYSDMIYRSCDVDYDNYHNIKFYKNDFYINIRDPNDGIEYIITKSRFRILKDDEFNLFCSASITVYDSNNSTDSIEDEFNLSLTMQSKYTFAELIYIQNFMKDKKRKKYNITL